MIRTFGRGSRLAVALICGSFLVPFQAHADSPLEAFCADNKIQLQRTHGEVGLDPATWASNAKNLARFAYNGVGDIDTLYHAVVDPGAPYIKFFWSNLTGDVQWRCLGQ